MHDAYIVQPSTKIQVQIESIAGYDNNVILGTRQGHLLMYSVQSNVADSKMDLQLMQYDKNFSKKPIQQIEVIPEYQLLFSLSDNQISVNDISRHNFPLVHSCPKTKGATVFTLDIKRSKSLTGETALVVRMCVAVKRKLQFWYWKHDKLLEFTQDIELNDVPKALAWSQDTICVGFKTEYVLYNISNKIPEKRDLFLTSSSRTVDPCIAIIDNNLFGVAKDEFVIAIDSQNPTLQELSKSNSFMTATTSQIRKEDFSTLHTNQEGTKLFKSLAWSQPLQMLVWDEPYAVALIGDSIEVRTLQGAGPNKDTLMQIIPDIQKPRMLIRTQSGLLFAASFSQLWRIQAIDIQKQRQSLLQQKNFQLALQLTNISDESEEDKKEKIHQIQTLYAFDLFANKHFQESMKEFAKLETDPCDVIRLFPDLLPQDNNKPTSNFASTVNFSKMEDRDLENGLLALIDYLTEVRYNIKKELLNASESAKPFGKYSTPLLSIIDTTMLKCYLQTNDSFVAPLLRLNYCHLEESERTLKKYQKYGELIILYQTKGQHKRALQLLQSQADIPGSSLYGHDRTIQYLQHLGSEFKNLIFEFAGWVLEKHPEDGLKIFTEDIQEVENLPRAEILDYLLKNHKQLVVPYLEHVIHIWEESKPIFHNILIQQYRDKVKEIKQDIETSGSGPEKEKEILLESIRAKLLDFLKKSNKYNPETVLSDFPYQDLFEERAIILGKMGKHEKVLAIYIQILGDVEKAIQYCEDVYKKKNDAKDEDIYILLIKTMLSPPSSPPYSGVPLHPNCLQQDSETVLEILEKHATKLNPHSVLQILRDSIPLWRLRTFLETALHHQLEQKRKTQVLKGLLYAEHLQIHEDRIHHESKNVLLTEYSVCPSCKKKFGNQSAFVRYPNGEIVHFSCHQKVSTLT